MSELEQNILEKKTDTYPKLKEYKKNDDMVNQMYQAENVITHQVCQTGNSDRGKYQKRLSIRTTDIKIESCCQKDPD